MLARYAPLATLLAACSPAAVATPPADAFAGRVVRPDGSPAAGAMVVISDAKNGAELAAIRADGDGRFRAPVKGTTLALTATLPDEVLYVPNVPSKRPVDLMLERSCERVAGRMDSASPLPAGASVRLARLSNVQGDSFGVALDSDGSFRACVPAGRYYLLGPDGFIERSTLVSLPTREGYVVRTDTRAHAERPAPQLVGITPDTAATFVKGLDASVRVLGLAESNHGTREFTDERTTLAVELARQRGFRLILIEAGFGETLALDDYINGERVDIAGAMTRLGYWIWDTKNFLAALERLRAFNATISAERRIHLLGFDVQTTSGAIEYVTRAGNGNTTLERLVADDGKAWPTLTANDRALVRSQLERLATTKSTSGANERANRIALTARSLLHRFDALEVDGQWERDTARNAGMTRMILDIMALEPANRATLWAHVAHLGREYVLGHPTNGADLAAKLGDAYRVYALLAASGSARAWDPDGKTGVIANPLPSPPAHSLEAGLLARAGGALVTYWTFARATGESAQWLGGVHPLRQFGSVFARAGREFWYVDVRSLDGAILFSIVTPTDPTPTGERRAKPAG